LVELDLRPQLSSNTTLEKGQLRSVGIFSLYQNQGTKGTTPANANASKQPFLYAKHCGETRKN
jgi:hypothetical protein